jgi:hypothetical protein
MVPLHVLVDAENVRRSRWPNIAGKELVELCDAWAEREEVGIEVVFEPPQGTADEVIVRRARELAREGSAYWLVTSDRGLRALAGPGAERVIGGGAFVELLPAG